MHKVLACDLDGVIFKFNASYINWLNAKFGCSIPPETNLYPDTWNYTTDGNYVTKAQDAEFWNWVSNEGNYEFWSTLPAYPDALDFLIRAYDAFNEVWFITSRPGNRVKKATEDALEKLGLFRPQVVISSYKVPDLIGVGATDFLDDRDKNFEDVLLWGIGQADTVHIDSKRQVAKTGGDIAMDLGINLWMLDRPWNRHYKHPKVTRVMSPMEIL